MKYILTIFLFTVFLNLNAQEPSKAQFDSLLVRSKIDFIMPDSCEEVIVEYMHKIPHNYAVGPKDSSFQIRYWVSPLDTWMATYEKKSKRKKKESMHPDELCKSMITLVVLNASGNKSRDYQAAQFPELTKQAYNADWDAVALVESGWPDEGYTYCYIWCLHKDGVGDIYIYILANEKEDFMNIMGLMAKSIKFQ